MSLGAELNNIQKFDKYGSSDYAGAIVFTRINPYLGFIAELGYSYNKRISSTRYKIPATKGLFAAIGYQVKLSKRIQIEFQYRALPLKYLETDVINSHIYLLGVNYSFK